MPELVRLLVVGIATWRVSFMLVYEDGPYAIFYHVRERTSFGGLLTCWHCMSVWIAAAFLVVWEVAPILVVVWAVSGAAIMLASYTGAGLR